MHQAKDYSQDIHNNIPLEWIVHYTPSVYMDRDGWLKSMTQFSNACGASLFNNQILLFDGHNSFFDGVTLRQMMFQNVQLFVLKSGNFINDHPNDSGPNTKLKSIYNVAKSAWLTKHGTKKFSLHH